MKPKKYEEVKILQDKTLNEIKRDFKAQTIITAEDLTEAQSSMISDLEENLKRLD